MFSIDKIPGYILVSLEKEGVYTSDLMLGARCDMNDEHVFCDTFVLATVDKLFVISGSVGLVSGGRGRLDGEWNETCFKEYDISSILSLKVEEMLSCARLVAKLESDEYRLLSAMTNSCRNSMLLFVKYFDRIKKGELTSPDFEIDPEDDPSSRYCPKCGMRYPDRNRKICPRCMEKGKLYRRFATFLMKYKKYIALMLLSLLFLTSSSILVPYISNEFFFDEVLSEGGDFYGEILLVIGLIVATRLLSRLFTVVNGYVSAKIAAKVVFDLKMTVFNAIERLSLTFFGGRQTGGLMTQVNNDSNTIYSFFATVFRIF